MSSITAEEIKSTLFSVCNSKSPGPDGFNAGFYKASWNITGESFSNAIREFFGSGKLLHHFNHTSISLIPKKPNPTLPSDFRPISCCNTTFKVIAKILASRINAVLPSIIGDYQGAFVKGRTIKHNILICHEIFKKYNQRNSSPRCALKVD